jgi:glycosyltransferase involved in cell wall biosynthesis
MAHALLFFPDYRSANPYQRLLYGHAGRDLHPQPATIGEALVRQQQQGLADRTVFHLHWEDAVHRNEPSEAAAWRAAQLFLDGLELFLDRGGQLVWTVHNEAPHDARYLAVHEALCGKLRLLADVVHVHSWAAAAFARNRLGVEPERLALIPHGNYRPLYPALGHPVADSRAALGLDAARRVVLLFGRLGGYKGAAELLAAFGAIRDDGLWLLIAGKQVDPLADGLARLRPQARRRVVVQDGFVAEADVPRLFHAADAVAVPYRASLTSGTALLALSQDRPVIAPALPGLAELLTDGADALLHAPGSVDALRDALERLLALDDSGLAAMRAAARAKALLHDWRQSGLLWNGVYAGLLGALRPQRRQAPPPTALAGAVTGGADEPMPAAPPVTPPPPTAADAA